MNDGRGGWCIRMSFLNSSRIQWENHNFNPVYSHTLTFIFTFTQWNNSRQCRQSNALFYFIFSISFCYSTPQSPIICLLSFYVFVSSSFVVFLHTDSAAQTRNRKKKEFPQSNNNEHNEMYNVYLALLLLLYFFLLIPSCVFTLSLFIHLSSLTSHTFPIVSTSLDIRFSFLLFVCICKTLFFYFYFLFLYMDGVISLYWCFMSLCMYDWGG